MLFRKIISVDRRQSVGRRRAKSIRWEHTTIITYTLYDMIQPSRHTLTLAHAHSFVVEGCCRHVVALHGKLVPKIQRSIFNLRGRRPLKQSKESSLVNLQTRFLGAHSGGLGHRVGMSETGLTIRLAVSLCCGCGLEMSARIVCQKR